MASRRLVLLGLGATLGGCGFRPLLKAGKEGSEVQRELAAVEVSMLGGRLGYLVRDSLLDQLNPTGTEAPSRYLLTISLGRRSSALGIQLDNTITRYNLTLTASFELLEPAGNEILYSSTVRRVASYNVTRAPYATLVAEQDAERRAAEEIGRDISTLLAVHFSRVAAA
jgi:LPS-assembly lipoprotein